MFGFLKKLLGGSVPDNYTDTQYDQNVVIESDKKNKLDNETLDEYFYIHKEPDPSGRINMENESNTIKGGGNIDIYDHLTGKPISQESISMEQVSEGVNIPGIGFVGAAKSPKQQQQPNRSQNQQSIPINGNNGSIPVTGQSKNPPSEVVLTSDAYHLYVDLAGVKKESVRLTFSDSILNISGKRSSMIDEWKTMSKGKGRKHTIVAQTSTVPAILLGIFEFKYPFKKSIDETLIVAEFSDGLLHVTLPVRAKGDSVAIAII